MSSGRYMYYVLTFWLQWYAHVINICTWLYLSYSLPCRVYSFSFIRGKWHLQSSVEKDYSSRICIPSLTGRVRKTIINTVKFIWNNSYLYCGCRWKWSDHRSKFSNLSNWKEEAWKFRASTGFEPVTSMIPVRCSTDWAMKPHIRSEVKLLISHHFTAREDMNSINWPGSQCVAS